MKFLKVKIRWKLDTHIYHVHAPSVLSKWVGRWSQFNSVLPLADSLSFFFSLFHKMVTLFINLVSLVVLLWCFSIFFSRGALRGSGFAWGWGRRWRRTPSWPSLPEMPERNHGCSYNSWTQLVRWSNAPSLLLCLLRHAYRSIGTTLYPRADIPAPTPKHGVFPKT